MCRKCLQCLQRCAIVAHLHPWHRACAHVSWTVHKCHKICRIIACFRLADVAFVRPTVNDEEEVGRVDGSAAVSAERRKPMQKNMPKLGTVLMVAVIVAWVGVWVPPAFANGRPWRSPGRPHRSPTGDDGDIQAGVPFPAARFTRQRQRHGDGPPDQLDLAQRCELFGSRRQRGQSPGLPPIALAAAAT